MQLSAGQNAEAVSPTSVSLRGPATGSADLVKLTADHHLRVEEERERAREKRQQEREEAKAQQEFKRRKQSLLKEQGVGVTGRVARDEYFVFYNNPRSQDGAVSLDGSTVAIRTDLLPSSCERVILVISADEGDVANVKAVVRAGSAVAHEFAPRDGTGLRALLWGEVYRRNGAWRF